METISNRTKGAELTKKVRAYLLSVIDGENYGENPQTECEKISFVAKTFKSEYGWMVKRVGVQEALKEWFMGLPSAINVEFRNYEIIQIAKEWGSIPDNATEKQEDKILDNWFNLCACKMVQMFRSHGIEIN